MEVRPKLEYCQLLRTVRAIVVLLQGSEAKNHCVYGYGRVFSAGKHVTFWPEIPVIGYHAQDWPWLKPHGLA